MRHDSTASKRCSSCGEAKPRADFHRHERSKDGLKYYCKECNCRKAREYQASDRGREIRKRYEDRQREQDKRRLINRDATKRCNTCGILKAARDFFRNYGTPDGFSYKCKVCSQEYGKRWQKSNPEKANAKSLAWSKRNPDWRRVNRKRRKEAPGWVSSAQWRARNGGHAMAGTQWRAVCEFYDDTCLKCGREGKLEVDHVIPIIKGGTNDLTNLQPLCRMCNARKHTAVFDYRDAYLHPELLAAMEAEGLL